MLRLLGGVLGLVVLGGDLSRIIIDRASTACDGEVLECVTTSLMAGRMVASSWRHMAAMASAW
uniref:Uncharacterized protein n=1 Tax=Arundo donax TaxID=35708 RepID=A0A0A9C872_ARUDO